jgi:endonuclease III
MKDLVCEEQIRITKKWHSLADPNASLEVRRFQVLVATRLHARCQESSVRKAMNALGGLVGDFTVDSIAEADPQILAKCITNVQYYNAKAQQIVKAAREIKTQYGGEVPEDEVSLLKITGVGKVFADLLAFVNTRAAYKYTQTNQNKITPETASRNPPAHIVTREV